MDIIHDKKNQRFYVVIDDLECFVKYTMTQDTLDVYSTYVPKALGGRGIAATLVKEAYDYADSLGLYPLGTCSYAAIWLKRNRE